MKKEIKNKPINKENSQKSGLHAGGIIVTEGTPITQVPCMVDKFVTQSPVEQIECIKGIKMVLSMPAIISSVYSLHGKTILVLTPSAYKHLLLGRDDLPSIIQESFDSITTNLDNDFIPHTIMTSDVELIKILQELDIDFIEESKITTQL